MDKLLSKFKHLYTAIVVGMLLVLASLLVNNRLESTDVSSIGEFLTEFQVDYEYLVDPSITTYPEITQATFKKTQWNKAPVKFGMVNQWLKVSLTNTKADTRTFRIFFDNPTIDKLTIYSSQRLDKQSTPLVFGDQQYNLSIENRIQPSHSFDLASGEHIVFWINADTTGPPFLPVNIMSEEAFHKHIHNLHIIWGSVIGIILLTSVYNLVLYVGVRDRAYLHYTAYSICTLLVMSVIYGFGNYLFTVDVQRWLNGNLIALDSVTAFFAMRFAVSFLRIDVEFSKIKYCINSVLVLLLIYGVISLFIPEHIAAKYFMWMLVVVYVLLIFILSIDFKSRITWTRYYMISWVPYCVGAAMGTLLFSDFSFLPYNFYTRYSFLFAVIFEMAFISMALADRMAYSERVRLFHAMHDVKTSFANESLLEDAISFEDSNSDRRILVAISIWNYGTVVPYLSHDNLVELLNSLEAFFTKELSSHCNVIELDPQMDRSAALVSESILVYLVECPSVVKLDQMLLRLSNKDNFNPIQDVIPYRICCDFGSVVLDDFKGKPEELLNGVKRTLISASENKPPYAKYEPNLATDSERKIRLAQDLELAIEMDELILFHQPQKNLNKPKVLSEVLLRWQHPQFGYISPVEFIEIAENTGLIRRLTLSVIRKAFLQTLELKQLGIDDLKVSINISAHDLSRKNFYEDVERILSNVAIDPSNITFEVTETSHLIDQKIFDYNLSHLKRLGFYLAVDDYGTGYSSLSYINDHFIDELKIDRMFVKDMFTVNRQRVIVEATISMAHKLGLTVTAEGIEDEDTLKLLEELNCDCIQGFFYAKPMSFDNYKQWLGFQ